MASIMTQTMPDGVSLELLDAVTEEMRVDADPPTGMIIHTHYVQDGKVHVFDIWEKESDYREFAEKRLVPAMSKVAERHGVAPPQPADVAFEPLFADAHRVVRGA